jgi:hypothetical protein
VIKKAFADVEQMFYLSQWFQNVGFTDVLKHAYWRAWVNKSTLRVKCKTIITPQGAMIVLY